MNKSRHTHTDTQSIDRQRTHHMHKITETRRKEKYAIILRNNILK
jgi:hypothetical protein